MHQQRFSTCPTLYAIRPFTKSISTHITSTPNQALPHPLPQPILDHARKNHQVLGALQQLLTQLSSRLALIFHRPETLPLFPDARDGPQEQRPDIAGDDGGEAVERGCAGADEGDRSGRFDGEEGEGFDHLRRMFSAVNKVGAEYVAKHSHPVLRSIDQLLLQT